MVRHACFRNAISIFVNERTHAEPWADRRRDRRENYDCPVVIGNPCTHAVYTRSNAHAVARLRHNTVVKAHPTRDADAVDLIDKSCSQPRVSHDDASDRHARESSEHMFRPSVSGSAWTLKDGVSTTRVVYRWLERHVDFDDKTCAMTVEGRMHVTARPHSGPRKQFAHTKRSHEMIEILLVND